MMKKRINIIALLVLLVVSLSGCSLEEKVTISNPVLAEALKLQFDNKKAAFTEEELASVCELTLEYQGEADLKELVYLPNLQILDITCGDGTNLSVLAELDSLEYLYISNMSIASAGALPALGNLKVLSLNDTKTTSVAGTDKFPELAELYILGSVVTDASAYEEELGKLKVCELEVEEPAAEENYGNTEVFFRDAGVEEVVRLTVNNMTQPITREQLKLIEALVLYGEKVGSVEDLYLCTNLKSIMLSDTKVTDVSVLLKNYALTEIIIYTEADLDYSALYESEQIKRLCINGEWIKDAE